MEFPLLHSLRPERFDTPAILKMVAAASRQLAELKGVAASIPHQGILINTLGMQEAKDSSAIENIVTTHDELFRDDHSIWRACPASPPSTIQLNAYKLRACSRDKLSIFQREFFI